MNDAGRVGVIGLRTHSAEACDPRWPCPIHRPSAHHMAAWPMVWRSDRGLLERTCEHGVGHPDPDHVARTRRMHGDDAAWGEGIHGCDGCCHETKTCADCGYKADPEAQTCPHCYSDFPVEKKPCAD